MKLKKMVAAILTMSMVATMVPVTAMAEGTEGTSVKVTDEAELKEALSGTAEEIVIDGDIEVDEVIKVERTVTISGGAVTGSATKTFEVYEDATFSGVMIKNTAAYGRCVDTRTNVELTLDDVELLATGGGNTQPLTIGGYDDGTEVLVKDSEINAGADGYGIISFVETDLTIESSEVEGYAALYLRVGTAESEVEVDASTLVGNGQTGGETNDFATVVFEDDGVTVT